jgi:hypothetical protein
VRDVVAELPKRRERLLQAVEHPVEGEPEFVQLGGKTGQNYPLGQRRGPDAAGRRNDALQRPQPAAGHLIAGRRRNAETGDEHEGQPLTIPDKQFLIAGRVHRDLDHDLPAIVTAARGERRSGAKRFARARAY